MNCLARLLCASLVLMFSQVSSQNLVPNSSFEDYSDPFCGIMFSPDLTTTLAGWYNPTAAAPQVFFSNNDPTCYNHQPDSEYAGPIGIKGNESPRTGEVMVGLWVYTIEEFNQRQYIQIQLAEPLEVGSDYVVEFHVSAADFMEYFVSGLGAYLSENELFALDDGPLNVIPQVSSDEVLDTIDGWVAVRDTITAEANFAFMTIGSFLDDSTTELTTNPTASGAVSTYGAYYFIDDVSVALVEPTGIEEEDGAFRFVYPTEVTSLLNVEVPAFMGRSYLEILDVGGRVVHTEDLQPGRHHIHCEGLVPGLYTVRLFTAGRHCSQRIIRR